LMVTMICRSFFFIIYISIFLAKGKYIKYEAVLNFENLKFGFV